MLLTFKNYWYVTYYKHSPVKVMPWQSVTKLPIRVIQRDIAIRLKAEDENFIVADRLLHRVINSCWCYFVGSISYNRAKGLRHYRSEKRIYTYTYILMLAKITLPCRTTPKTKSSHSNQPTLLQRSIGRSLPTEFCRQGADSWPLHQLSA